MKITDDNVTPTSQIDMGSGVVGITAGTSIQMHQYVDMLGNKISGLAAGDISATSTEAINGSQLYAAVNDLTTNISNGTIGLVQQNPTSRTITVAKDTDGTVVDVTGTTGARQVTGVAAGELSAASTDAVNGSQLYATNQQVDVLNQRVANIAIGGATFIDSQANDAPAAATGANSTALGNGAQATGANSVALGDRSVASEDNTVSVGSAGNERRVTNVAAGVNGTDAANMNQLNAVQSSVNTVAREAFAGVAAAMAMPNLTPREPGKTVVAAGVANYKGYTAVGVGGTYRSRDSRWLVNGALSLTGHGDTGVRAQVGYEF
uniref:YadA family autotransporter adhesin n=1 Tax=Caballeronia calidae TaxID=1777139 RepID=UPI000786E8CE|nr:YadA-like family protein [Caballeronia calidae]